MILNFGALFQKFSKDLSMRGKVFIPEDKSLWPETWKINEYKTYKRFPDIVLPKPELSASLEQAVMKRESIREYKDTAVTLHAISTILFYSCGINRRASNTKDSKSYRAQPSGGERYPLEIYVVNRIKGDLEERVYHYNVLNHSLEALWELSTFDSQVVNSLFGYGWANKAPLSIIITGIPERTTRKYGERGYRYMYLEAGAVAHMANLVSTACGLGSVIVGGMRDTYIEQLLDIDGENETVIIGIILGNKK